MEHNAEPEAVDLLMEVENLEKIVDFINEVNYQRVCMYLLSCSCYSADPEEMKKTLRVAFLIYMKLKRYPESLRVAIKINDLALISKVMEECTDQVILK